MQLTYDNKTAVYTAQFKIQGAYFKWYKSGILNLTVCAVWPRVPRRHAILRRLQMKVESGAVVVAQADTATPYCNTNGKFGAGAKICSKSYIKDGQFVFESDISPFYSTSLVSRVAEYLSYVVRIPEPGHASGRLAGASPCCCCS